jgi:hypothetical protein
MLDGWKNTSPLCALTPAARPPVPPTGGHPLPAALLAQRGGARRSAVLRGLDTHRRRGEGRTARGDAGGMPRERKATWGMDFKLEGPVLGGEDTVMMALAHPEPGWPV